MRIEQLKAFALTAFEVSAKTASAAADREIRRTPPTAHGLAATFSPPCRRLAPTVVAPIEAGDSPEGLVVSERSPTFVASTDILVSSALVSVLLLKHVVEFFVFSGFRSLGESQPGYSVVLGLE